MSAASRVRARESVCGGGIRPILRLHLNHSQQRIRTLHFYTYYAFFLSSYALIYLLILRTTAFYINLEISVKSVKALELLLPNFTAPLPDQIGEAFKSA